MKKFLLSSLWLVPLCQAFSLHKGNQNNDMRIQVLQTKISQLNTEKAEVCKELGLLYQQQEPSDENLQHAVDAFQQAIELYQNEDATMKNDHNQEETTNTHKERLAYLYFQLGQTYYQHWTATVGGDTYLQSMQAAWKQSTELQRSALTEEDPLSSYRYAMICVRQGMFLKKHTKNVTQAWDSIQEALVNHLEPVWERLLSVVKNEEDLKVVKQQRIRAWFQAYQTAALQKQYQDALQALQPVLKYFESDDGDTLSSKEESLSYCTYAQALYLQADLYFHLKLFKMAEQSCNMAKERYQQEQSNLSEAYTLWWQQQQQSGGEEWQKFQELIQMYRNALQEHNERLQESKDPNSSAPGYRMDHGFIGDLHAALGTTLKATNELAEAETHLRQAIQCYASAEEDNRQYLADAHYHLSQLLFPKGECAESADHMLLACQLYHERQQKAGEDAAPTFPIDISQWMINATDADDEL